MYHKNPPEGYEIQTFLPPSPPFLLPENHDSASCTLHFSRSAWGGGVLPFAWFVYFCCVIARSHALLKPACGSTMTRLDSLLGAAAAVVPDT